MGSSFSQRERPDLLAGYGAADRHWNSRLNLNFRIWEMIARLAFAFSAGVGRDRISQRARFPGKIGLIRRICRFGQPTLAKLPARRLCEIDQADSFASVDFLPQG
jgi:hypothetical protein